MRETYRSRHARSYSDMQEFREAEAKKREPKYKLAELRKRLTALTAEREALKERVQTAETAVAREVGMVEREEGLKREREMAVFTRLKAEVLATADPEKAKEAVDKLIALE